MKSSIIVLLALLLFTSCEIFEEPTLSKAQKQFLLYDVGSHFYFLKNNKDTIELEVESIKDIDTGSGKDQILTFKRVCLTNSNIWGSIRVERDNNYTLYFSGNSFTDKINNMTPFKPDTIINSRQYKNVYFMGSQYNDTLFFSLEKGIIQIKSPRTETTYERIE